MKFFGLLVIAVCLGTSSAGFLSKVSSTANSAINAQVNLAKHTVNTATNVAKSTMNTASNVAQSATNMAVNTAESVVKAVSTTAINSGITVFLAQVRALVKTTGNSGISIPKISTNMGPITFNATGGFFRDISTLAQAGKTNVSMNGTSIIIDIPVKLNDIDTGYNNFTVNMWKLNAKGGLKVHIANDTFVIRLRLKPGITCALNVEKVDVTEFGGIEMDFYNMGSKSEWVLEKCSSMIVKFMKANIKKQVQTAIDTNIKKMLKENGSICSKFLG